MHGSVYILENPKAQRVKIGMTINDAAERLKSVNDMWLESKATCQICGGRRLVNEKNLIPKHVLSGRECPGGDALPLEKDVSLAKKYLERLKKNHSELSGSKKGSTTRIVNNLKNRIELYRNHDQPVGMWKISTIFYTESAEEVELLSHEILAGYLDAQALFGEVFSCSVPKATEAIESALNQLGLLHSARKEIKKNITSEKYGKCGICGNNLTETGVCPDCNRRG
jgi:DNA-directed RNA polymerase subunit RPC12/RpoP